MNVTVLLVIMMTSNYEILDVDPALAYEELLGDNDD